MLGHIISERGIEVDKAKVELISKFPSPTNVKTVRQGACRLLSQVHPRLLENC